MVRPGGLEPPARGLGIKKGRFSHCTQYQEFNKINAFRVFIVHLVQAILPVYIQFWSLDWSLFISLRFVQTLSTHRGFWI
jgi:hypothetical protein